MLSLTHFDVPHPARQAAQALGEVHLQQAAHQVPRRRGEVGRHREPALHRPPVGGPNVRLDKGRRAREHFINQHARRPPVGRGAVPLVQDDFRRQVVGRAAQRVRPPAPGQGFGETKVRHLQVPARIQQKVFGLQVPVHDPTAVQGRQGGDHFRRVEAGGGFRQAPPGAQGPEELAAGHVLKGEVDALGVLDKVTGEEV